jgi:hypothetical protein
MPLKKENLIFLKIIGFLFGHFGSLALHQCEAVFVFGETKIPPIPLRSNN